MIFFCLVAAPAFADKLVAPIYPGAVPFHPGKSRVYLTKDSYDQVKDFYVRDRGITPNERVFEGGRIGFFEYVSVREVQKYDPVGSAIGVQLFEMPTWPASVIEDALANLKVLSLQGILSEAEYKRLVQEYKPVIWWFFPLGEIEGGTYQPMDEMIFARCEKGPVEETLEQDAETLAKKAQELMAQGKHQEAMQLMQQLGNSVQQYQMTSSMGQGAVEKWISCLQKLKRNAYPTRIEISYHPSAQGH